MPDLLVAGGAQRCPGPVPGVRGGARPLVRQRVCRVRPPHHRPGPEGGVPHIGRCESAGLLH